MYRAGWNTHSDSWCFVFFHPKCFPNFFRSFRTLVQSFQHYSAYLSVCIALARIQFPGHTLCVSVVSGFYPGLILPSLRILRQTFREFLVLFVSLYFILPDIFWLTLLAKGFRGLKPKGGILLYPCYHHRSFPTLAADFRSIADRFPIDRHRSIDILIW